MDGPQVTRERDQRVKKKDSAGLHLLSSKAGERRGERGGRADQFHNFLIFLGPSGLFYTEIFFESEKCEVLISRKIVL